MTTKPQQQQPNYKYASMGYLIFVRNFIQQKVREQFMDRVSDDTREFLRFVAEPNVATYSSAYQTARNKILDDYQVNVEDDAMWNNIFGDKRIGILFRYYFEMFKYVSGELYEDFSDEYAKYDFLHSKINGGSITVYNPFAPTINEYVEMRLKNSIIYDVMNLNEEIQADMRAYYEYLMKRRVSTVNMSLEQMNLIKYPEDLERYALCLIGEWGAQKKTREKGAVY